LSNGKKRTEQLALALDHAESPREKIPRAVQRRGSRLIERWPDWPSRTCCCGGRKVRESHLRRFGREVRRADAVSTRLTAPKFRSRSLPVRWCWKWFDAALFHLLNLARNAPMFSSRRAAPTTWKTDCPIWPRGFVRCRW
jgi:hypothetical protein